MGIVVADDISSIIHFFHAVEQRLDVNFAEQLLHAGGILVVVQNPVEHPAEIAEHTLEARNAVEIEVAGDGRFRSEIGEDRTNVRGRAAIN